MNMVTLAKTPLLAATITFSGITNTFNSINCQTLHAFFLLQTTNYVDTV